MALRGQASQSNVSTNTTATVNVGGIGIALNDIVLLFINSGGGTTNTFTYPSGFAAVPGLSNSACGGGSTIGIAYKVATGSEPSNYSVVSTSTDFQTLLCRVYSGRLFSAPFSAVAQTANQFNNVSPVTAACTGLTAVSLDDVVILMGWRSYDGSNTPNYVPPSGYSGTARINSSSQFSPVITGCSQDAIAAGATGTNGGVYTVTGATNLDMAGYELSLALGAAPIVGVSSPMFHRTNKLYMI